MAAEIEITFNTDGTTTIHTTGVKGKSCKEVSAFIEKELGSKVSDTNTSEYYQQETNNTVVRRY